LAAFPETFWRRGESAVSKAKAFLAFDLGAESGRAVVGRLHGGRLELEVVHRFPNIPVQVTDGLHWDVLRLFGEMKNGLREAARDDAEITSIGVDTWGVDAALLDGRGVLLCNPYHYRDSRTDGAMDELFKVVDRTEVFEQTGIQFMQLNTLYQLFVQKKQNPELLDATKRIILIPDLFNYWFTGEAVCEFTEATTSQMYNPRKGGWASDMLKTLGLPVEKMGRIVPPGSRLADLLPSVAEECACQRMPVVAPACHDTGSAVAAVPASGNDFAYLSSGTWSLIGVEVPQPVINERSLAYNFTNEGGVQGTFRLLKNVMGLWLVQECRRTWEKQGIAYDYTKLTALASEAAPFRSLVDPDNSLFLAPGDMPSRIQDYCRQTGQAVPETPGETVRTALDSLALKYRWALEKLEELTGRSFSALHIVGGGTQNKLLTRLAADATGKRVVAGPIEATATGNILMQAIGMGELADVAQAREVVRASFDLEEYTPAPEASAAVEDAYGRFLKLLG